MSAVLLCLEVQEKKLSLYIKNMRQARTLGPMENPLGMTDTFKMKCVTPDARAQESLSCMISLYLLQLKARSE